MYKFFGEPLKIITSKTSNKPLFRFDTKGEFFTNDPEIIRRAMGFFDYLPMKAEISGERVKKTHTVPPLTITTKDDKPVETPIITPAFLSDEQVRAKAKAKGIKSWHTKKIENLLIELKEE